MDRGLPASACSTRTMQSLDGRTPLPDRAGAPIVCVVDDDAPLRRAVLRLLRGVGFAVESFGTAEDFLAAGHARRPDCLVLDIHLGVLSGFDLHDHLRAAGLSIPTVFITGHDDAVTRERARRVGAAGYVRKPFEEATLVAAIEHALAG
jgi:FixJ family two-component response regulator